jgi:hypothetical protein
VPVIILPVGALVSAEILEGRTSRRGRPKRPLQSRSRPPEWYHPRAVIIRLRTVEFHGGSPGVFAQVFYRRSRPRFQAKRSAAVVSWIRSGRRIQTEPSRSI